MTIQTHTNRKTNFTPDCEKCGGLCCKSFSTFFKLTDKQLKNYDGLAQDCQKRFSHLKTLSDKVFCILLDNYEVTVCDDPCEYFIDGKCSIHESDKRPEMCKLFPHNDPALCELIVRIEAELNKLRAEKTQVAE